MAVVLEVTETEDLLLILSDGLSCTSLHRRLGVLETLVEWLHPAQSPELISKPEARALVRLLLSSLCNPQYLERVWITGLYNAVASAAKSERCPTFTPMCAINLDGEFEWTNVLLFLLSYVGVDNKLQVTACIVRSCCKYRYHTTVEVTAVRQSTAARVRLQCSVLYNTYQV